MRKTIIVFLAGISLLVLAAQVRANQRVALVIGNARYAHAPALANPLNDAGDLGSALGRLGFKVTRLDNAGYFDMIQGLRAFTRAASTAEVALVFYAGHGIEVDKRNFLIPVDARLQSDREVEFETVSLDLVSRAVEGASGLGLVVLDACRDNPFAAAMKRSGAKRSIGRGLARVEPSGETLVAYAAKGGSVAADGAGRNSPYTTALLAHVEEPGLEVGLMFRKVRDAVLKKTNGQQEPFVYGSLSSKGVYLKARPKVLKPTPAKSLKAKAKTGPASVRAAAEQVAVKRIAAEKELLFWQSVKDSRDPADIRAYLTQFPGGTYEALARNRLKRLSKPQAEAKVATVGRETVLDRKIKVLVQRGLASLGLYKGFIDGAFGPKTREAVRSWQKAKGFDKTGRLTKEQAEALAVLGEGALREKAERERMEREAREKAEAELKAREAAERERKVREARENKLLAKADLAPKCSELESRYLKEKHTACWEEMHSRPGCHAWNAHYHTDRTAEWTGACPVGVASGSGTYTLTSGSEHSSSAAKGSMKNGKRVGHWTVTGSDGSRYEGEYRDGKRHGRGIMYFADGERYEGVWQDGNIHGPGVLFDKSGSRVASGNARNGCFGRRGGRWVVSGASAKECGFK